MPPIPVEQLRSRDRLQALLEDPILNGIDFVEIANPAQTQLNVHFVNGNPLQGTVSGATITGGETIPSVEVLPFSDSDWRLVDGRPMLTLHVRQPGDFSFYTLTLIRRPLPPTTSQLDPHSSQAIFSFKAGCPSDLDCASPCPVCPPLPTDAPPIDYLAKDFLSFRQALLDFSALRYPEWQERSEADFGMVFLEALCGLADDLSYLQDRVAAEAYLDTATQRRSIVRHARLVDYEPRASTVARVLLQFDVTGGPLPAGLVISAQTPDGLSVDFETGTGLADTQSYPVSPAWNRWLCTGSGQSQNPTDSNILPYLWDANDACLKAGATSTWIQGWGYGFKAGQRLLIDTSAPVTADPPIREIVQLVADGEETIDPLFIDQVTGQPFQVTKLVWRDEDRLKSDHDLTRTALAGNLVPATQGRRYTDSFAIDQAPAAAPQMPLAIARSGPAHSLPAPVYRYADGNTVGGQACSPTGAPTAETQYLYTLSGAPLAWITPADDPEADPVPEIRVVQQDCFPSVVWDYYRRLLEAGVFDRAFTVEPARYARINMRRDGVPIFDYDGDAGDTIRFGDGIFGLVPEPGSIFQVQYRVGGGTIGNVAADTITRVDPQTPAALASLILGVTNPMPAEGGNDQETNEQIRRLAPQKFSADPLRAVRPEDYVKAAKELPWVLQAGTVFRWTGSWLTVFTTADPRAGATPSVEQRTDLIDLLNRRRLAGYESYAPLPHYVSIDLKIYVCALPTAFRGDVEPAVLFALRATQSADGTTGFFYSDNFTFGTPLEPSRLEAAIQNADGVAGVIRILYRWRGYTSGYVELSSPITIGRNDILRVENDPSRPERGSIRVYVEGGK